VDPLKILLFAANPFGDLNLDEEIRRIEGKLDDADLRKIQLVAVPATRPGDLIDKINTHRPQVVQFSGHGIGGRRDPQPGAAGTRFVDRDLVGPTAGDEGHILVIGEDGKPKPVGPRGLVSLFRLRSDLVKIVVLNACSTQSQAEAIAEHIDCVIGTTRAISDDAARIFAARLYRSLGLGYSVATAFDEARIELELQGFEDQAEIPRLWTKQGLDPKQIYLAPRDEAAPPKAAPAPAEPPRPASPEPPRDAPALEPASPPRADVADTPAVPPVPAAPHRAQIHLEFGSDPPKPEPPRLENGQPRIHIELRWWFGKWAWIAAAVLVLLILAYAFRPRGEKAVVTLPGEGKTPASGPNGKVGSPGPNSKPHEPGPSEPAPPLPIPAKEATGGASPCERVQQGIEELTQGSRSSGESIRIALVLNEHATPEDLVGLFKPASQARASLTGLVFSAYHPPLGENRHSVLLGKCGLTLDRRVTCMSTIPHLLDRKDVDVVVFVAPLKERYVKATWTISKEESLDVLRRNATLALLAGKDIYVSSREGDAVQWREGQGIVGYAPGFKDVLRDPRNLDETPINAARLYRRVTSYGGRNWEDFAEFLKCVKNRSEPAHSFQKVESAPD
jgi:hypothetical protein